MATDRLLVGHLDRAVAAVRRRVVARRLRWAVSHPPRSLPVLAHKVWPHVGPNRAVVVRALANAGRWAPALVWATGRRKRSPLVRLAMLSFFIVVYLMCGALVLVAVLAVVPLRLVVGLMDAVQVARGWTRPARLGDLSRFETEARDRLAEIRRRNQVPRAVGQVLDPRVSPSSLVPTGELPPWEAPLHSEWAAANLHLLAEPTIVTAPHYVQVPPPPGATRARVAQSSMTAGGWWLAIKVLIVTGLLYVTMLGCIIQVGANRLSNRQLTSTTGETAP